MGAMGLGPIPISGPSSAPKSLTAQPGVAPPAFRYTQQPPPMKSCLSCHQQIHRMLQFAHYVRLNRDLVIQKSQRKRTKEKKTVEKKLVKLKKKTFSKKK